MKTKIIDWSTLADWIEKVDKPGEDMGRLLETVETELQVAVLLVGHAAIATIKLLGWTRADLDRLADYCETPRAEGDQRMSDTHDGECDCVQCELERVKETNE